MYNIGVYIWTGIFSALVGLAPGLLLTIAGVPVIVAVLTACVFGAISGWVLPDVLGNYAARVP